MGKAGLTCPTAGTVPIRKRAIWVSATDCANAGFGQKKVVAIIRPLAEQAYFTTGHQQQRLNYEKVAARAYSEGLLMRVR